MQESELKEILQQPFNLSRLKTVIENIFENAEWFTVPHQLDTNEDKVQGFSQIGSITLKNYKKLLLFDVEVTDNINISLNRKGLRDIAAKYIDQEIGHGALAFYHTPNQNDYRLSFIAKQSEFTEEGEFVRKETHPKRFTYVLGPNESCKTPAKRFLKLSETKERKEISINDVITAFSVEKLNKNFFKDYKKHFEKFSQYLIESEYQQSIFDIEIVEDKEEQDKLNKPIREFTKKLLGRIVFLHFLQKKSWMGCSLETDRWENGRPFFIQDLFSHSDNPESFHSVELFELFYNTLNNPQRPNDTFRINGKCPFNDTGDVRVPYLNGGLFDFDLPDEKEKLIDFPPSYFEQLLEFFSEYNFTIDENSPDDKEVSIDPEMLGHIFENLLEDNRDKGTFYTPKEIVHYMCQESLIKYLNDHLTEKLDEDENEIQNSVEKFIRHSDRGEEDSRDNLIRANAPLIEELLDRVKICDPAIGSGAFPMGMLKEIFNAKLSLDWTLDRALVKKNIILNSIYGVDFEPGAVDIARLRFWLALVVDEPEPQPLPNLDYKIMQGDSLLERFEDVDLSNVIQNQKFKVNIVNNQYNLMTGEVEDPQTGYNLSDEEQRDIKALVDAYYRAENKDQKEELHEQIDRIVIDHIDRNLELYENRLLIEVATLEEKIEMKKSSLKNKKQQQDYLNNNKQYKELQEKKEKLDSIDESKQKLINLEHSTERPFFLWHLYFKDVFAEGGFDIVIGNPPYLQIQSMDDYAEKLEKANYDTFTKTGDIYCLFYELGTKLLKEGGVLTYITSNKWMNARYGKNLRKFFLDKTNPQTLIDFGKIKIFQAATVFVNILIYKNETGNDELKAVKIKDDFDINHSSIAKYLKEKKVHLSDLDQEVWVVSNKATIAINDRIEEIGTTLKDWGLESNRGVTTGLNKAFHITNSEKENLIEKDKRSSEIIKPLLRGRDIKRYNYDYQDKSLIFTRTGTDIDEYPEIKQYLNNYYKDLKPKDNRKQKRGRKPGNYKWFEIQDNTTYYEDFEKDKIIWIEISDHANYCLDTKGMFLTNSAYYLTGDANLKYILAVLNSRLMDFYFFQLTAQIAGGRKRYTKQYVEQLPIPQVDVKKENILAKLVDYMSFLKDSDRPPIREETSNANIASFFDEVINGCVYELYFEDHMREREIAILQMADEAIKPIGNINADNIKADIIFETFKELRMGNHEIYNRIRLFGSRSPEYLRPIIEN